MQFTILIDSAEQHPFTFQGIRADANSSYEPIIPSIQSTCLGRHPNSLGDYSLLGGVGRCHIERKSMEDAHSTILGFNDGHRERFESELRNLATIEAGLVIVECTFDQLLQNSPSYGKKTAAQNAKILFRSVLAYQQDCKVPWLFCDGRGLAEHSAYWFLHRFWEKNLKEKSSRSASKGSKVSTFSLDEAKQLLEGV